MSSVPNLADLSELERRKKIKIRLRRDLGIMPHRYEGRLYYVVKDPVSLRYYRFKEHERFLLDYLDGQHTLEQAQKAFEQRFRPERLTLEDLEAFTGQLLQAGLAQNETPGAGKLLYQRFKKRRRSMMFQAFMNIMYIKVPLIDPDKILAGMVPWFGFIFTRWFLALSVAIMLSALALVLTNWSAFVAKLPAYHEFFSLKTIVYLWIALGLVKIIHEFGHGLSCKTFGGEVHEMGLLFLVFSPCMYCNVSDAWTLPNKWHRIIISAAGIYVELIIAALATFVWWSTTGGTFVNTMAMSLMVVCSISTFIFNANPLMRFDGYYVMADWLEIPNLREKSNKFLSELAQEWCLGIEVPPRPYMELNRQVLFVTYAIVSYLYRWVITFSIIVFMFSFLEPYKLGAISYLLGMASLATMIGMPVYQMAKAVHRRGRLPDMKPLRVGITTALSVAVLVSVFTIPLPVRVSGATVIQPDPRSVQKVVVPEAEGYLRELAVRDGETVQAGDILARLDNPELTIRRAINQMDIKLRRQQIDALKAELLQGGGRPGPILESLQSAMAELETLEQIGRELERQRDRLTLRADRDGTVMQLLPRSELGKRLERGSLICQIGDSLALRAVLLVTPADKSLIQDALAAGWNTAYVRVHGRGSRYWTGAVESIAAAEAKEIPPQLSSKIGGDVATQADAETRAERPQSQHYMVTIRIDGIDGAIHPGVLGRAKIVAQPRTLYDRLMRYIYTTFSWGL